MRVVLDTNQIIAAGTAWGVIAPPAPAARLAQRLIAHVADNHTGLLSGEILGEYTEKLYDGGHPPPRLTAYLGWLMGAFERVQIVSANCNPQPVDADDTKFLLCAIDGHAQLLVSDDPHLLDLAFAYNPPQIQHRDTAAVTLGVPA